MVFFFPKKIQVYGFVAILIGWQPSDVYEGESEKAW